MSAVLAIAGLEVKLTGSGVAVLHGIDLKVDEGEVRGLVGESGAGKTMLARTVLGNLPRTVRIASGSVRFAGQELVGMGDRERRRLAGTGIALVPQNPMTGLNPAYTIGRQMTGFLRLHVKLTRRAAQERALAMLDSVQVREPARVLRQYPHELSGGMRQRVLIAMAFALQPRLIVADEPTTALDVTVQRQILRLVRDLQRRHGTAILFVTHDLGVVAKLCDTVTVMRAGRIVEQAAAASLFAAPADPYTRSLLDAMPRYDRLPAAVDG